MNLLLLGILVATVPGGWLVLSAPTGSDFKVLPNTTGGKNVSHDGEVRDAPEISDQDAELMLGSLGYGDNENGFSIGSRFFDPDAISDLLRAFQSDYGLPQTGVLDEETKTAIFTPKCGLKKGVKMVGDVQVWDKTKLTYSISNYPNVKGKAVIRDLINRAFEEWSKVTNLDFVEVNETMVDIEVSFGGRSHQHRQEECSFDNPNTLAHAFLPNVGDLHFNTDYFFDDSESTLADFFDTALHEIGHSLGLEHNNSSASLMHPTAGNQFTKPQPMDVQAIQSLYGVRNTTTETSAPKFCTLQKIDAALMDADGSIYVFAGDFYYDMSSGSPSIGRLISSKWPGLPGNVDAAFRWNNGGTYFFKRDKFWRFKGNRLKAGYPKAISVGFPGLPSNVDAIYVDEDADLFVFKGSQYWLYFNEESQTLDDLDISEFGSEMPASVDAALTTNFGQMMVFKGSHVYRFVAEGVEKRHNEWFSC